MKRRATYRVTLRRKRRDGLFEFSFGPYSSQRAKKAVAKLQAMFPTMAVVMEQVTS